MPNGSTQQQAAENIARLRAGTQYKPLDLSAITQVELQKRQERIQAAKEEREAFEKREKERRDRIKLGSKVLDNKLAGYFSEDVRQDYKSIRDDYVKGNIDDAQFDERISELSGKLQRYTEVDTNVKKQLNTYLDNPDNYIFIQTEEAPDGSIRYKNDVENYSDKALKEFYTPEKYDPNVDPDSRIANATGFLLGNLQEYTEPDRTNIGKRVDAAYRTYAGETGISVGDKDPYTFTEIVEGFTGNQWGKLRNQLEAEYGPALKAEYLKNNPEGGTAAEIEQYVADEINKFRPGYKTDITAQRKTDKERGIGEEEELPTPSEADVSQDSANIINDYFKGTATKGKAKIKGQEVDVKNIEQLTKDAYKSVLPDYANIDAKRKTTFGGISGEIRDILLDDEGDGFVIMNRTIKKGSSIRSKDEKGRTITVQAKEDTIEPEVIPIDERIANRLQKEYKIELKPTPEVLEFDDF